MLVQPEDGSQGVALAGACILRISDGLHNLGCRWATAVRLIYREEPRGAN